MFYRLYTPLALTRVRRTHYVAWQAPRVDVHVFTWHGDRGGGLGRATRDTSTTVPTITQSRSRDSADAQTLTHCHSVLNP